MAPTSDPNVAATIITTIFKFVYVVINPPNNRTASDGIGGKMFSYFVKNYNPDYVKSFADRRWTLHNENNLYTKLGFKLDEILKLVGLDNTGKKTAKHFSLGMKQRLGIAISLVGNPDLLILDEPINGLDPEGIIEIRELILRLNREKGITFLISSHYLDELSKIATCYGIIDKGRIIKEINKDELEQNFKIRTQINVTNLKECVKYLEEENLHYKVISNEKIDIYEKVNVSELVIALSKRNCIVNDFQEKGESLENYYLNLIGGANND